MSDGLPTLVVVEGQAANAVFLLREGKNLIGRGNEQHPVDINLVSQEPTSRTSVSRKHAVIHVQGGQLSIEDVGSSWGTVVNNILVRRGMVHPLRENDLIRLGDIQLKLTFSSDLPAAQVEQIARESG